MVAFKRQHPFRVFGTRTLLYLKTNMVAAEVNCCLPLSVKVHFLASDVNLSDLLYFPAKQEGQQLYHLLQIPVGLCYVQGYSIRVTQKTNMLSHPHTPPHLTCP